MPIGDVSELFQPQPVYLVALLLALAVAAFRSRRQPIHRWRWAFAALAAWSWLFSAPAAGSWLLARLEGQRPAAGQPADARAVIVLSSGQLWGGDDRRQVRLDVHGWERLYEGVQLWRDAGGRLLFTGGPPDEPGDRDRRTDSMASRMSEIARNLGVPAAAIVTAAASVNTYEELAAAERLLREQVPAGEGVIWLVTSAAHMPRAMAVARKLGLQARPYPVDFRQIESTRWHAWLPHNSGPRLFELAFHELIGLVAYRLRGWAD